ncbi:hypothetical protein RM704_10535 [Streptomyces sp. DSM 3412]|uniref:Uncharacterized protein n=1 Tax=Streptomyces gottesmaniae TaxID=3075518 RepID=A0ABU2YUH0_9ACTN|nr:hypothetical protein [Streptomyces sp. DSM 3412]MDT0567901.1 hypothetical protein [Streptomyces sp. DSM 3412]
MADSQDMTMGYLASRLGDIYTAIALLCTSLPVKIVLPIGSVSNVEVIPAVRRVAEIVEDQPMPEEVQAELFASCVFWLAAIDLYGLLTQDFHEVRVQSALANLIMAEDSAKVVAGWIKDQLDS